MLTLLPEDSWHGLPLEKIPHPVLRFQDHDAAIVVRSEGQGAKVRSVRVPTVINVAYDITDNLSDSELALVLSKACDTFIELSTASVTCFIQAIERENTNYRDVFCSDEGEIYPLASQLPEY